MSLLYACFNLLHVDVCSFKGLEKISTKKRNDVKKQVQKTVEKRYCTRCNAQHFKLNSLNFDFCFFFQ